jgi:hypothetical protein
MIVSGAADIAVVLVGFNSRENLGSCLASLFDTQWGGYSASVVFVDNASSDGSSEFVRSFDRRIQVIENTANLGFCQACNQAVAATSSRFVYLLNNDTTLLPNSIPLLAEFLDSEPRAGVAGNRLLNADGTDQWSARRFPGGWNALFGRRSALSKLWPNSRWVRRYLYKDGLAQYEPFPVDWVPGSCSMVRRQVYYRAGCLPEDMHYWSDAVFSSRVRKAGYEVYTVPRAVMLHHEGEGTGRKDHALRKWLIEDFHRGAFRFYCEHYELRPGSLARWTAEVGLSWRAKALVTLAELRSGK